jgi:hypothetical protein
MPLGYVIECGVQWVLQRAEVDHLPAPWANAFHSVPSFHVPILFMSGYRVNPLITYRIPSERLLKLIISNAQSEPNDMRKTITEAEYTEHLGNNLQEAFELCAGLTYLEVIKTCDDINPVQVVGRLVTFESRCAITSVEHIFHHVDGVQVIDACLTEGSATEEFIAYDNLDAARSHAVELLAVLTDHV